VYPARLTLTAPDPVPEGLAELIHDAVWAHLPEGHALEHITVVSTPRRIDLVLFLRHGTESPDRYARRLIESATRVSPALAALRLVPCGDPADLHQYPAILRRGEETP
jgi:hypothetical protein